MRYCAYIYSVLHVTFDLTIMMILTFEMASLKHLWGGQDMDRIYAPVRIHVISTSLLWKESLKQIDLS